MAGADLRQLEAEALDLFCVVEQWPVQENSRNVLADCRALEQKVQDQKYQKMQKLKVTFPTYHTFLLLFEAYVGAYRRFVNWSWNVLCSWRFNRNLRTFDFFRPALLKSLCQELADHSTRCHWCQLFCIDFATKRLWQEEKRSLVARVRQVEAPCQSSVFLF